jgi:hypothetical protein
MQKDNLLTCNAFPGLFLESYGRIQAFDVLFLLRQDENYYPLAFVQVLTLNLYYLKGKYA